jgi:hypothetical protein
VRSSHRLHEATLAAMLLLGIVTATLVFAKFTKGDPLVSIIGMRNLENLEWEVAPELGLRLSLRAQLDRWKY